MNITLSSSSLYSAFLTSTFDPGSGYPNYNKLSSSITSACSTTGVFGELFGLCLQLPFLHHLQFLLVHLLSTSVLVTKTLVLVPIVFSVFGIFDVTTDSLSSTTGAAGVIINFDAIISLSALTIGGISINSAVCVLTDTASLYCTAYPFLPIMC